MDKNKKIAWLSTIGGIITSILGILGAICVTPICGTICISGFFTTIAGVGMAAFFHKYHLLFLVIGICLFIVGIILIIMCRRKCICTHESNR